MKIDNQGTVVLFIPETDEEYDWLQNNTQNEPHQWRGKALVADHRPARELIEAVVEMGFVK